MARTLLPLLCMSIILIACNENLPVREDLGNLVTTKIRTSYFTKSHSNATGSLRVYVTVVNNSDETLEDVVRLTGVIEITWIIAKNIAPLVELTGTVQLNPNNIFYAKQYNTQTRRLILDPKDSLIVFTDWNLKSDDGTYLFQYFPATRDSQCYVSRGELPGYAPRSITLPQKFKVSANIKIFDKLAVLYAQPMSVKHCFMVSHAGEAPNPPFPPCTDFTQFDPCFVIGQ